MGILEGIEAMVVDSEKKAKKKGNTSAQGTGNKAPPRRSKGNAFSA